jgi:hypothetical protein
MGSEAQAEGRGHLLISTLMALPLSVLDSGHYFLLLEMGFSHTLHCTLAPPGLPPSGPEVCARPLDCTPHFPAALGGE